MIKKQKVDKNCCSLFKKILALKVIMHMCMKVKDRNDLNFRVQKKCEKCLTLNKKRNIYQKLLATNSFASLSLSLSSKQSSKTLTQYKNDALATITLTTPLEFRYIDNSQNYINRPLKKILFLFFESNFFEKKNLNGSIYIPKCREKNSKKLS